MRDLKNFLFISILLLLFSTCTKVMDLGDEVSLDAFVVKSVTPSDIQLGTPVIKGDTIEIPVVRGVTLFPMSISAEPVFSAETEQAVTGTSFASFDDIKFDLEDIQFNAFYLVAKSGFPKPYYIKLDIENQEDRNDFKEFNVSEVPLNNVITTKGFVNPIKRTITLYGLSVNFPLAITAKATLSENAYIKDANSVLDSDALQLSFAKYGDSIMYNIEAENGAVQKWKIFLRQAKTTTGSETSDILAAISLDAKKQSAEIKSPAGYKISEIGVNNKAGELIFVVAPITRSIGVEIVPNIKTMSNSQILGYKTGESVFFENYNSTGDFIVFDSRTGYYKNWKFVLNQGDVGDIYTFPFTYSSRNDYIVIDETATVIDNIAKRIKLKVTRASAGYWPLTVTPGNITYSEGATISVGTLSFNNISDSAHFGLESSLGVQSTWKVELEQLSSSSLNIDSVQIISSSYPDLTGKDILISASTADIFIDLKDKSAFPLRIQPYLYISEGAEFESFQNGDFMEFRTFNDTVKVKILSKAGESKTWKFQLLEKSQLQNSNFELWITSGTPTIDPIPGKGRGWATANNVMVRGTAPVTNGANGLAAEMTTDIISMPKNLITSATLLLGYFDMSTISLDQPRKMTKFGIPFEAKPIAVAIDVKYLPGDNYQKSRLVSGSGIFAQYVLDDIEGEDKGHIYTELIHWNGKGQLNYAGEPVEGVHVLARGERVISGKSGWSRLNIPLERRPEYEQYQPTHLVFVAASSIEGHLFIGAKGSKLTVDNFELIY